MFNYSGIDKVPTVVQVSAIIKYMEDDPDVKYDFTHMMTMTRLEPDKIELDLNNAHYGKYYEIVFIDGYKIKSFKQIGEWMS